MAQQDAPRRGFVVVISGPSGAGKTALCETLLARRASQGVAFSVSLTTRRKRSEERHGIHYHFVTRAEFQRRIEGGEFLEWAQVYGDYYGTPRANVEAWLARGVDVLLDIDTQGAAAVRAKCADAVLVFVMPPSPEVLEARILQRGTERPEQIRARLAWAAHEIEALQNYDYCVVNDNLEQAEERLWSIILAERCRVRRQSPSVAAAVQRFEAARRHWGSKGREGAAADDQAVPG